MLSVVIPVFNAERFLCDCVDSVIACGYEDLEVILIDDGSTDDSPRICDAYAARDERITVIHQENSGAGSARNRGIAAAHGDYITFLDSDDWWEPGGVANVIAKLESRPDCDFAVHFFRKYFERGGKFGPKVEVPVASLAGGKGEVMRVLANSGLLHMSACGKVLRLDFVRGNELRFPTGTIAEDIEWGIRTFVAARNFVTVEEGYYVYRKRAGSVTSVRNAQQAKNLLEIIRRVVEIVISVPIRSIDESRAYWEYLSFQFAVLLALIGNISGSERKTLLSEATELSWLLGKSSRRAIRLIYILIPMCGLGCVSRMLGMTLSMKERRQGFVGAKDG